MSEEKALKDEALTPEDYNNLSLALKNLSDAVRTMEKKEVTDYKMDENIKKMARLIVERVELENERLKAEKMPVKFDVGEEVEKAVAKLIEQGKIMVPLHVIEEKIEDVMKGYDDLPEATEVT